MLLLLLHKQYEALLGSVENTGHGSVQTVFYHLLGFPLWPQDSYFVTKEKGETVVMEIRRSSASILAAYLTWWPAMLSFWLAVVAIVQGVIPETMVEIPGDPFLLGQPLFLYLLALGSAAFAFVAIVARLVTRRALTSTEKKQRAVFAALTGSHCDVAQLDDPWSLRDDLKRGIADAAEAMGWGSHLFDRWADILEDPRITDPRLLRMGLVVARIHVGHPEPPFTPERMDALFQRLWQRLQAVDPSLR